MTKPIDSGDELPEWKRTGGYKMGHAHGYQAGVIAMTKLANKHLDGKLHPCGCLGECVGHVETTTREEMGGWVTPALYARLGIEKWQGDILAGVANYLRKEDCDCGQKNIPQAECPKCLAVGRWLLGIMRQA